jgi:ribosomal protein S27E
VFIVLFGMQAEVKCRRCGLALASPRGDPGCGRRPSRSTHRRCNSCSKSHAEPSIPEVQVMTRQNPQPRPAI